MPDLSFLDEIINLPESTDKRDLEWCASIAQWTSGGPELRAINVATRIALRLLKERLSEGKTEKP